MEECSLKMIRDSLSRCSALLSKCLDINIIGKVLGAGYILFCLIGAGNFYECCRGTETLSQGSPEARSQNITKDHKGKSHLFSPGNVLL